jgi:TolB protein
MMRLFRSRRREQADFLVRTSPPRYLGGYVVLLSVVFGLPAADLDITRATDSFGFLKPVPVHVTGFSGEVDAVLKQDLRFMGVVHVPLEEAQYLVTGSHSSRLEGRLLVRATKEQKFGRAYTGGSLRAQTHRFADDVANAVTGLPGIAQKKITFKVESGLAKSEVYIADYDGHTARAVTQDGSIVAAPTWVDPSTLVYGSYKMGQIYVYSHNLPTGTRKAVSHYPGSNMSPAVSPDGKRIALILGRGGNPDLYVRDLEGNNLLQLTRTREAESSPTWSPDGRTICFVSRERGPASLYTISASGGEMRRLNAAGVANPTEPDWSPDGKWIAFTSQARDFSICIVDARGGVAHTLVSGEDPSWAPNSRALIFCRGRDHGKVLSLLDVPTKHVKDIARIQESNSQPSWAKR